MTQGQRQRWLRDVVIEHCSTRACPYCGGQIDGLSLRKAGQAFGIDPARIHRIKARVRRERERQRAHARLRKGA